jgi:hypothetical protein
MVSREGDAITIRRNQPADDDEMIDIVCIADKDECKILTFDENPEQVMIVIQKTRECVNGAGDCDFDLHAIGAHDGLTRIRVEKRLDCGEDKGNCQEVTLDHTASHVANRTFVIETLGEGHGAGEDVIVMSAGGNMMFFGDGKISLSCPEGDTTMRVSKEEVDDVFLCPKHSLPLEKQEHSMMLHRIERLHDDDEHK